MLKGKTVVIGVTGGIAAYKIPILVSQLKKKDVDVHVIMTANSVNFINPITFEVLSGNKCIVDTFDRNFQHNVEHIALAKKADLFLIAPATANTIGKVAYGLADNMLTTTWLASICPKVLAPAMNTQMYNNPITQKNLSILEMNGVELVYPTEGLLACGDRGEGKMAEPEILLENIEKNIGREKDMKGLKILITAGATREALDPVRFITNHSTGRMGVSIAKECALRGGEVTLVRTKGSIMPPSYVHSIDCSSAEEMFQICKDYYKEADIIVKAAAVADYKPAHVSQEKVKKKEGSFLIEMERTEDILKFIGENRKKEQVICGFSMETENMIQNSKVKLKKKNADIIVANNLKVRGAGFGTETNVVTFITENSEEALELMSKEAVANRIVDRLLAIKETKCYTEKV